MLASRFVELFLFKIELEKIILHNGPIFFNSIVIIDSPLTLPDESLNLFSHQPDQYETIIETNYQFYSNFDRSDHNRIHNIRL